MRGRGEGGEVAGVVVRVGKGVEGASGEGFGGKGGDDRVYQIC